MSPLYFAYGSCMNEEDLAKDVARYQVIGPAVLRDHRIGFTRFSQGRWGGVADLVPQPGDRVEGVLYRVPEEELTFLDAREGAPDHYQRTRVLVETQDGRVYHDVLAYTVVSKAPTEIPPHPDYARTILQGARRNLSRAYVRVLERRLQAEMKRYEELAGPSGRGRDAQSLRRLRVQLTGGNGAAALQARPPVSARGNRRRVRTRRSKRHRSGRIRGAAR